MKRLNKNYQKSLDKIDENTWKVQEEEREKAGVQIQLIEEREAELKMKLEAELSELNMLKVGWSRVASTGYDNKKIIEKICEAGNIDPKTATKRQLQKAEDEMRKAEGRD